MLIMDKKEKQTMAKKHGRVILFEKGWGAAKLIRMENPADHDGKVIFSDPISVPRKLFKRLVKFTVNEYTGRVSNSVKIGFASLVSWGILLTEGICFPRCKYFP